MQGHESKQDHEKHEVTENSTSGPLDLLNRNQIQNLQDHFAVLGRISILIQDNQDRPLTSPSCAASPCLLDQSQDIHGSECVGARKACCGPDGAPPCHTGASLHSVSIDLDGKHIGTIIAGIPAESDIERMSRVANECGVTPDCIRSIVDGVNLPTPESPARYIAVLADILAELCKQRSEIRRRVDDIVTVCDLTGTLSSTEDIQEAMTQTAARVCEVMGVKAAAIRLVDVETRELVHVASHNLSKEYLQKGAVSLEDNPIDQTTLDGETVYLEDVQSDPRFLYREDAKREGLVSGLSTPIAYRGDHVGILRVYSDKKQQFTTLEVSLLKAIGSQIAAAIVNSRLFVQQRRAEAYQRQLEYAATIQHQMIPPPPEKHAYIDFGAVYDPRLEVGGDFYDFIGLPDHNLGLSIADVVGKGVPAGLLMASVRSALRAHAHSIYGINEIMAQVNRLLCRDTQVNEFATLFYGVFSGHERKFTYCNAGHEPPILMRGDDVTFLRPSGMVIGLDPSETYNMDMVDLIPGDVLVFLTDGVTEAMDFNEEFYGRERVIESIRKYRDLDAPAFAQQLLWDVRRFVGLAEKFDDITLVVAKVRE